MRSTTRKVRVFRYDPAVGGDGHFDNFVLDIPDETTATMLDVLLRIQREQDATVAFRFACRVNMCGSCGMVINGQEALACKTNVSDIPPGKDITLRPLNHFPVIKDLVVDMDPLFTKFEQTLSFFEPKDGSFEPALIPPDAPEREEIRVATDCIACGCCVSSCTMVHYHEDYAGPAALNRAYSLLADNRDAWFEPRLTDALASCYNCRTEINCTEVCPKEISSTRAIKYIQRLALTHREDKSKAQRVAQASKPAVSRVSQPASATSCGWPADLEVGDAAGLEACATRANPRQGSGIVKYSDIAVGSRWVEMDRATFLRQLGVGVLGAGTALALGGEAAVTALGPALGQTPARWIPLAKLSELPPGQITTVLLKYDVTSGIYTQPVSTPVLVSRLGPEIICYKAGCPHLGCIVRWDASADQFRCACHGGTFDRNGNVLAGPPPRPLDHYRSKVEADQLLVEVV